LAKVKGSALSGLRDRFKGQLIGPDDPEYDQARVVWNATADRRPAWSPAAPKSTTSSPLSVSRETRIF
jgi:hypothetical protein